MIETGAGVSAEELMRKCAAGAQKYQVGAGGCGEQEGKSGVI